MRSEVNVKCIPSFCIFVFEFEFGVCVRLCKYALNNVDCFCCMYCECVLCTYTYLVSDPAPNLYMYARILTQKHVIVKLNAKLRHNKWCVQKEFLTKIDGIYIYASKITHTHKRIRTHKTKIDEENNQRSNKKMYSFAQLITIPFHPIPSQSICCRRISATTVRFVKSNYVLSSFYFATLEN